VDLPFRAGGLLFFGLTGGGVSAGGLSGRHRSTASKSCASVDEQIDNTLQGPLLMARYACGIPLSK
jgi:hypothetical protein